MQAIKIPKLSAARAPRRTAMPRFRKKDRPPMTLADAVLRVLMRLRANNRPFGVFVTGGRLAIYSTGTDRYKALSRRPDGPLVATYGPGVKVSDVLEDLREHFTDEVANAGA
jgi:hypothetical protein